MPELFFTLMLAILCILPNFAFGEGTLIVPFTIDRNRVIIPTSVNGSSPLRLILDSGMGFDGVYLFHKSDLDLIDTTGAVTVNVGGAGDGEASTATMIETGHIAFGEVTVPNQRIIVSHSSHTQQFPTDGVAGWNFFGHYIVEIDYDQNKIFLHDTTYSHTDSSWLRLPIERKKNLPFLDVTVEVILGEVVPMRVYIDLASEEALELLMHDQQKFTMPDSVTESSLGYGLSGEIKGRHGKSAGLQIGKYMLHDIRTAFAPAKVRSKQEGADGILGNNLIRRFNIIFDYPHNCLYIKPNRNFEILFD